MENIFNQNKKIKYLILLILFLIIIVIAGFLLTLMIKKNNNSSNQFSSAPITLTIVNVQDIVELSLVSSNNQPSSGKIINVELVIDAKQYNIAAAEIYIEYDPTVMTIISLEPTQTLPVVLEKSAIKQNSASIIIGSNPQSIPTGKFTMAKLMVKINKKQKTIMRYSNDTKVAATNEIGSVNSKMIPLLLN